MDVCGRIVWLHLTTASVQQDGQRLPVHDLKLLPELDAGSGVDEVDERPSSGAEGRWSPMYLVSAPDALATLSSQITGTFWLLYDNRPVQLAAMLQRRIPDAIPHGLFLTHGMASVVLLLQHPDPALDPSTLFAERSDLSAIERWTVTDGRLISHIIERDTPGTPKPPFTDSLKRVTCSSVPRGILRRIHDNTLVVGRVLELSAKHRPRYAQGITDLQQRVRRLFGDIDSASGRVSTGDLAAWRSLQSSAYSLTHLNSMWSCCLSQGLSGTPPVSEHYGLLPSYSLFGVATAYKALWGLTHFIEEGFRRYDVMSEMRTRYHTKTSSDYAHDLYRPELNDLRPANGDAHRTGPGHLNLFSGRLGFHSSKWAVAAPVDALYDASTPGRNLLTLSHELLHVHVEALLALVLSPCPQHESSLSQNELYRVMTDFAQLLSSDRQLTIMDRIRQKIWRYILQSSHCRRHENSPASQLPRTKTMGQLRPTSPAESSDWLRTFWRRLNEYIVHILDFHYFYGGDVDRFLFLVLSSWGSIASVYDDIGHYAMRCLLTVSTREMEPATAQGIVQPLSFDEALQSFRTSIASLHQDPTSPLSAVVTSIEDFLSAQENAEYLRMEFERATPLVWIAVRYFYCRPLRMYFALGTSVPEGMLADSALCPEFELGAVQERLPSSPVAFLWKYLSSEYAEPEDGEEMSVEAQSAWLFSWIASCDSPDGG